MPRYRMGPAVSILGIAISVRRSSAATEAIAVVGGSDSRNRLAASVCAIRLRCDGDLDDAVALVREQVVRGFDVVEREAVRDQLLKVEAARLDQRHQLRHALLAAGAERGEDVDVADPVDKGFEWHGDLVAVDAK